MPGFLSQTWSIVSFECATPVKLLVCVQLVFAGLNFCLPDSVTRLAGYEIVLSSARWMSLGGCRQNSRSGTRMHELITCRLKSEVRSWPY